MSQGKNQCHPNDSDDRVGKLIVTACVSNSNTFLHVFSSNFRDFMNSDRVKLGSLKEFNAGGHSFANNKLILISFQTQGYCYNFASLNTKIISRYLCNNCRELL